MSVGRTTPGPVWFSPSVPTPVPTLAVTVQLVPLPVTEVMAEPLRPVGTSVKAAALTPATLRLNVTFHDTVPVTLVWVHEVAQLMAVTTVAGVV